MGRCTRPGSSKEEQEEDREDDDERKEEEDDGNDEEEEDDDDDESPAKKKKARAFAKKVAKARFGKFEEDTDLANYMRGILLGLGEWVAPTQAQIDASSLFKQKPSDKSVTPANITRHWLSLIGERGLCIDKEAPHQLQPLKGKHCCTSAKTC